VRKIIGKKSTEDSSPPQANLILSRARRGTVNLARRCPRGKVSTKGRIVADSLPVVSIDLASLKFLDHIHELSEVR
jgi:hypothetical protein